MSMVFQSHMAAPETTSGPLQLECQKTTTMAQTAPVPPTVVVLHLHLWEKTFSVSLGTLDDMRDLKTSGTLMTLCGTHRGVQMGAPAVIVVVRGSLPHYLKQPVTTLK